MNYERNVIHIPLRELPYEEIALRFQKHTGIDLSDIPAKYGSSVTDARSFIDERLELVIVYQCFDIKEIGEKEVTLATGHRFTGPMPSRILKNAEQVVCFVASLPGFNDIRDAMQDFMDEYFLDIWGTVYAEYGLFWMETHLRDSYKGTPQRSAYSWNPGQHKFELRNQKPLFELLKPEDIGVTLDRHMRMIPFKSTSGIIPVVPETVPDSEDLVPCELCPMQKTCPASKARRRNMAR